MMGLSKGRATVKVSNFGKIVELSKKVTGGAENTYSLMISYLEKKATD